MSVKEKIVNTAAELFLKMGIRNVTMDQLAAEVGISKRTIYECFNDKEEIILETLHHMTIQENNELLAIMERSEHVVESLFLIMKRKQWIRNEKPELFRLDMKKYVSKLQQLYYSRTEDLKHYSVSYILLERGVEEGIFRKDLNIQLVDAFFQDMIGIVLNSQRISVLNPTEIELSYNIFLPYFRGICTPKGLKLMDTFFEQNHDIHTIEK